MKITWIVFIVGAIALGCYLLCSSHPQSKNTASPQEITETVSAVPWPILEPHPTDPSLRPKIQKDNFVSQIRMIADFDGNGMLDIGLPEQLYEDDSHFTIYLRTRDGYKDAGFWDVEYHRYSLSIEHVNPPFFSRLWSSWQTSDGDLISFIELQSGMIVTNSMFPNFFQLAWPLPEGVENGNKIPDAIHDAIFDNSASPIWWEKSVITNGMFKWLPVVRSE